MVPASTDTPIDPAQLAEAFRLFSEASAGLSEAYSGLQAQVAQLTAELAYANGELRRQYQEKAALNERLAMLLAALPAGVAVLDAAGIATQANPAAVSLCGADFLCAPWDPEGCGWQRADTPGEWLTPAGRRVAETVTELDSAGGRIVLLHDVTETHRMQVQAARNERLAAMGEMVAGLAHQLRTPLSAALLYAAHLGQAQLPAEERARIAGRVVERLQHLERLIRDMLTFARGEAGLREEVPVKALVTELAHTVEPLARTRGIAFEVADGSGTAAVAVNRKELHGALLNLLDNALQAVEPGGHIGLVAEADGATLRFRVRDDGRGIDAALQARLFEPFFTTRADGTGLGLAIARGVARAHGGDIELNSAPGRGSEFVVSLPLRAAG